MIPVLEQTLGPRHARTAKALNERGNALFSLGKLAEAKESHEKALSIRSEIAGGDTGMDVAASHINLGNVGTAQRQFDEALMHQIRAHEINKELLGDVHPDVATSLHNIANVYLDSERFAKALDTFRESIVVRRKTEVKDHPYLGVSILGTADSLFGLKRYSEAEVQYVASLEIMRKTLGADHPFNGYGETGLAETLFALQRPREAIGPAERALKIRQGKTMDAGEQGDSRWICARILWALGKEKERAVRLAVQAMKNFRVAGVAKRGVGKEVSAWLDERQP